MESNKEGVKKQYVKYVRENGKRPNTVYAFCELIQIAEKDFYVHFTCFNHIERTIWLFVFDETIRRMKSEPVYDEYGTREKLLSFFYTLVEVMKEDRSFLVAAGFKSDTIKDFKTSFLEYARFLLNEGTDNNEIQQRMILSNRYADVVWFQTEYVIKFWLKDESAGFEKTDAAIEKAVNLCFDIFSKNIVDSAFDFVKFAFQNRK